MSTEKRRIEKISKQIDKIATRGKNNVLEYYRYVDDLVLSNDYDNLLHVLRTNYEIDISKLNSVEDIKLKTWKVILSFTKSLLSRRIKKLYDANNVYQIAFDIYESTFTIGVPTASVVHLGTIREFDMATDETKYLLKNREFSRIMGTRRQYLEVFKTGATSSVIFDEYDFEQTEDQNLYNKYVLAVNLLKS